MGQDYYICNVSKKLYLAPYYYDEGGKMVEHAFMGNSFLYELLYLLSDEWKGDLLYHCGDHCDWESVPAEYAVHVERYMGARLSYHKHEKHGFPILDEKWRALLPRMWQSLINQYVIVNYDQNIYCAIDCCPINYRGMQFCPLPLLLSNSDIIIGGDYKGWADHLQVGTWRYNRVGLEPKDSEVITEMQEKVYSFIY